MTDHSNRISQRQLFDALRSAVELEGERIEQIDDDLTEQVGGGAQPLIGTTMGFFPTVPEDG